MMPMRGLFLLLLLSNALLFLYYALQRAEVGPQALLGDSTELKLVSEVPRLQQRTRPDTIAAGQHCITLSGIDRADDLARIEAYLQQGGYVVQRDVERQRSRTGFALVLEAPADNAERLALLDRLDMAGIVPESRGEGRLHFFLGSFASEAAAVAQQRRLQQQGIAVRLHETERLEERYRVRILLSSGRALSNEINAVLQKAYPGIKIEKNVCEGVARPRGSG